MKRWIVTIVVGFVITLGSVIPLYSQDSGDAERNVLISAVMAASEPRINETTTSQDAKWKAEVIIYDCAPVGASGEEVAYEVLELTETESNTTRTLGTQLRTCGGLGAIGLSVLYWSENNRYLYYTDAREGTPDGGGAEWLRPIFRAELSEISVTPLGGGVFSPNWSLLATWDAEELTVWNTNDTEAALATFPLYMPGSPLMKTLWLPDSSGLIYLQSDFIFPQPTRSYLIHADIVTAIQTLLLETSADQ